MQKDLGALTSIPRFIWKVARSDAVITWFADASKFPVRMARMFNKRSIVIIGGYDVAKVESIGYGALIDHQKAENVRWTLENANAVTAVDGGLIDDLVAHFGRDFGAIVVPTGYDGSKYVPAGDRDSSVLSVCSAHNRRGQVKGVDVFAECARRMPEVKFRLIGVTGEALDLLGEIPANLEVLGSLPHDDIIGYYQKAKVYCQLSMREGLPNAVCEAMLCGCIVVGSNVQGVRTAVGDHGYLVPYGDAEAACQAIKKALDTDDLGGREWIIANFSEKSRKSKLLELLRKLDSTSH